MAGYAPTSYGNTPDHLFTWVDVDAHLAFLASEAAWPQGLHAADSWWDSLELVVSTGTTTAQVRQWLDEVFGADSTDLIDGTVVLGLDDPRTSEFTGIPVALVGEHETTTQTRRLPLLREKHITHELANPLARPSTDRFATDVQIVAFHSFKGGVGRTLHAVAVADLIARRGGRALLVDADLEAPRITWMHSAQGGQRDFSYQEFLSLPQGDEDGNWSSAVDIAAAYLPNQQVGQYRSGGRSTVVPASRRSLIYPARIEPADLLTSDRSPYFLTEALAALADKTGADTVVVDLRAGASELSAPVLLDPRVQRVFATTLSHQSLAGTELLVRQLGRRAPAIQGTDPATSVILTQYRHDVHAAQAEAARAELSSALVSALAPPDQDPSTAADPTAEVDTDILSQPVLSPFREGVLALPSSWNDVLHVLESCEVSEALESLVSAPVVAEQHASGHVPEKSSSHHFDTSSRAPPIS